jgi:hypothetical protein
MPTIGLILSAGLVVVVFYQVAILTGLYKDSLMADFRHYGEERKSYPLPRFLWLLAALCFLLSLYVQVFWLSTTMIALALVIALAAYTVTRMPRIREALPLWYDRLMLEATRQERRAIAYAWLRLSRRTRMRLNGDGYAFQVFTDEIRLTVIYGARDPDDPWAIWA